MKLIMTFTVILFVATTASAQFQLKKNLTFDGTAQQVQWVDLNNDSLLDVVITIKKNNYFSLVALSKITADTTQTFFLADSIPITGLPKFYDWNGDNKIDAVFPQAGSTNTFILLNQGNFSFQKSSNSIGSNGYSKIEFADLNNDAQPDAVVIKSSGGWAILKNNLNQFNVISDSSMLVDDFALFDFDKNGYHDIALCGMLQNGQPFLSIYEFDNNFQLARKIQVANPVRGKIEIGDVNEDGLFDLLVSGKDPSGGSTSNVFLNNDTIFTFVKKYVGLQNPELRVADLNSDGQADLSFFGQDGNGNSRHWILTSTNDSIPLPTQHITHQAYGDYDRDGDLDLLMATDTLSVVIFENQTVTKNQGPSTPSNSLGLFIYNRIFMYWQKPTDDHTSVPALTYDVSIIEGTQQVESCEFDLHNSERLAVTHGNQGTNNFSLLRISRNPFSYSIQSIDNSFTPNPKNICHGQSGPGSCLNFKTQTLTVCNSAPLQLQSPQPVMWFSFSKGYLGTSDSVSAPAKTDTLFSFLPAMNFSCNDIKVYLINKSTQDTLKVSKNIAACKGSSVWLTVAAEWKGVVWKDKQGDSKGTGDSLNYLVNENETLTAIGHNDRGCALHETENLTASIPTIKLNGQDFKIMLGQSVSLVATGTQEYLWQPSGGLNDNTISDPVASPTKTTQYTVKGFDSLRCSITASILIEVTDTAFVPTLFTPNGDGKNDELKIYGLNQVHDFEFTVYNREGSIVFDTSDLNGVSTYGWDGTKNGTSQPTGLYFWKVEGHFDSGQAVMLNGKTKGSVMLLR